MSLAPVAGTNPASLDWLVIPGHPSTPRLQFPTSVSAGWEVFIDGVEEPLSTSVAGATLELNLTAEQADLYRDRGYVLVDPDGVPKASGRIRRWAGRTTPPGSSAVTLQDGPQVQVYFAEAGPPGPPGADGSGTVDLVARQRATATVPYFHDAFDREDGPLGADWINAHDIMPTRFEPLGIYDEAVVCTDPMARGGVYADNQDVASPPPGELFKGIGCAWRETGSTEVSVKITWSGNWDYEGSPVFDGHHVEATPLLYVTPGHPKHGFGCWPSALDLDGPGGSPHFRYWYVGYVGNPPEDFVDYILPDSGASFSHTDGTPQTIEIRTVAPGEVILLFNGVQVSLATYGLNPIPIDPELAGSTLHGMSVDAHYVWPDTDIPTTKAIEDVTIEVIGANDAMKRSGGNLPAQVRLHPDGANDEWRLSRNLVYSILGRYANATDTQPQFALGSFSGVNLISAGPGGSTPPTAVMQAIVDTLTIVAAFFKLKPVGATSEWRAYTVSGETLFGLFANGTDAHPRLAFGLTFGTPLVFAGPGGSTAPTNLGSILSTGFSVRHAPRVGTVASAAAPAINTDNFDLFSITAQAAAITSMTTNLTGTPVNGQTLVVRIKDNGTARAITWGAKFASGGVALPTTTVVNKVLRVAVEYDTVPALWRTTSVLQEP